MANCSATPDEPPVCCPGGTGGTFIYGDRALPSSWPVWLNATLYTLLLIYFFLGVARLHRLACVGRTACLIDWTLPGSSGGIGTRRFNEVLRSFNDPRGPWPSRSGLTHSPDCLNSNATLTGNHQAIVADIFMAAIEAVTSVKKTVKRQVDGKIHVYRVSVWNATVANLTLMYASLIESSPFPLLCCACGRDDDELTDAFPGRTGRSARRRRKSCFP